MNPEQYLTFGPHFQEARWIWIAPSRRRRDVRTWAEGRHVIGLATVAEATRESWVFWIRTKGRWPRPGDTMRSVGPFALNRPGRIYCDN